MAVVKADCYSNGINIACFIEEYVCGFAVANVFEGVQLRELGIKKPILALSFKKSDGELCKKYKIMASICNPKNYVRGIKYHIAIDSGMNRGGLKRKEELFELLSLLKPSEIAGVYSHIYSQNEILTSNQIKKFNQMVDTVEQFNRYAKVHIFASNYKHFADKLPVDFVRLGIGLYDKAVAVTSNILQIKDVKKGETIGYDGQYVASQNMKIALCEGGYFDGVIRRFCGQKMAFNTDFCKVIGKISMDSHIVDISDLTAKVGDEIVIYDTEELSFERRAADMQISEYELMTALRGRFEYVYFN